MCQSVIDWSFVLKTVWISSVGLESEPPSSSSVSNLYSQMMSLSLSSHLLQTGSILDLVIISERQIVKGISRIVAVTGPDATRVSLIKLVWVCLSPV